MSLDILNSVGSIFSPVTRQVSAFFGDSEERTDAGLRSSYTTLLASMVQKSTAPGGAHELYRTVTSDRVDPTLSTRLASLIDNRSSLDPALANGESLAGSILGNRTGSVANAISEVAGIKSSSAMGLLAMAAPLLLSVIKRGVTQGGLDAPGLGSLLLDQRSSLMRAGLDSRITNAMGFGNLRGMFGAAGEDTRAPDADTAAQGAFRPARYSADIPVKSRERRWIPWAIAAAVVALVIALLSTRGGPRKPTVAAALPASVYFEVGEAGLSADDRKTIETVASAVKGSDAPLAVTGYTDPTGNPNQNLELAKNRATAVRDALVQEGVPAAHVLMTPPTSVTSTGSADDARRVEIRLAGVSTETQR